VRVAHMVLVQVDTFETRSVSEMTLSMTAQRLAQLNRDRERRRCAIRISSANVPILTELYGVLLSLVVAGAGIVILASKGAMLRPVGFTLFRQSLGTGRMKAMSP